MESARKAIITEIAFHYLNLSNNSIRNGELVPNCEKCHLPVIPDHANLNQTNCTDCHRAHIQEESQRTINITPHNIITAGPHKNKTCRNCHGINFEIPRCTNCHSGHEDQKLENSLCLACHSDPHVPKIPGIFRNNTVYFNQSLPFSVCKPCHEEQYLKIVSFQTLHTDMGTCTECHQYHGEKPNCSKCHKGMMLERHTKGFVCRTCHLTYNPVEITCQDCHGRSHEWSPLTAILNPK